MRGGGRVSRRHAGMCRLRAVLRCAGTRLRAWRAGGGWRGGFAGAWRERMASYGR